MANRWGASEGTVVRVQSARPDGRNLSKIPRKERQFLRVIGEVVHGYDRPAGKNAAMVDEEWVHLH